MKKWELQNKSFPVRLSVFRNISSFKTDILLRLEQEEKKLMTWMWVLTRRQLLGPHHAWTINLMDVPLTQWPLNSGHRQQLD